MCKSHSKMFVFYFKIGEEMTEKFNFKINWPYAKIENEHSV